jgi:hypothetical protein
MTKTIQNQFKAEPAVIYQFRVRPAHFIWTRAGAACGAGERSYQLPLTIRRGVSTHLATLVSRHGQSRGEETNI